MALAFLAGIGAALFDLPPTGLLRQTRATLASLINGPWFLDPQVVPRRYPGLGLVTRDAARSRPGLTLVQGMFDEGPQVRVYDAGGALLHAWPLDFAAIWPAPAHIVPARNVPRGRQDFHSQGMALLPDGSLVVTFAEKGTVRLGPCGQVIWRLDRMTHHVITEAGDGSFWIPVKRDPADIAPGHFIGGASRAALMDSVNYYADGLLHVSSDGRVLQEVNVLEPVLDWLVAGQRTEILRAIDGAALDPFHLNDVEIATPALAARIPGARPGDLLLSLRNIDSLALMDPVAGRIRWLQRGPWLRQHDPDIGADGTLTIFDNGQMEALAGRDFTGSRILHFDPASGATDTLYPQRAGQEFFSFIMGSHQWLPDGNLFIAESTGGRIFEVAPDGTIVWAMHFGTGTRAAAVIEQARRYPPGHVDPAAWACPD